MFSDPEKRLSLAKRAKACLGFLAFLGRFAPGRAVAGLANVQFGSSAIIVE
jgi:hypothetical protein